MIHKSLYLVVASLLIFNCASKKVEENLDQEMIICTMQFVSIPVEIKGETIDELYLINNQTKEKKVLKKNHQSFYTLIDDSSKNTLKNKEIEYTLIGKHKTQKVIEEPYILGADACHVYKKSGKDIIVLN